MTHTEESEKIGNERDKEREKHRESQAAEQPGDVVRQTRMQPETERNVDR